MGSASPNHITGIDITPSGPAFVLCLGQGDLDDHNPGPPVVRVSASWPAAVDIIEAAQTSQAALESHLQSHHSALYSWWQGASSAAQAKLVESLELQVEIAHAIVDAGLTV
jgi:hypothetical protein